MTGCVAWPDSFEFVSVAGDTQTEVLEDLRDAVRYRAWICALAEPWLGDAPVEIGSGVGDYAEEWARPDRLVTASDARPSRVAELERRFRDSPLVRVQHLVAPTSRRGEHSAVVAINVLEHIEDDVEALRSFRDLLAPDGHVVVFVPAFPALMSDFDGKVGHVRRYRRASLAASLDAAGFDPLVLHHVNAPGFFAWFLIMRLLGGRPRRGILLKAFEALVPVLSRVEGWHRPPFGQSLFAVARPRDVGRGVPA